MTTKKAILLINIGSPLKADSKSVAKYLREFLTDGRVLSIPRFFRYLLVYGLIVPFRAPKSAKKYQEIWTDKGSPLLDHSIQFSHKLRDLMQGEYDVFLAMRYGNPSINSVLKSMQNGEYTHITICPLYPQNASSTTASSLDKVFSEFNTWENIPSLNVISEFWNNQHYLSALSEKIKTYQPENFDHLLISFHGLPLKQVSQAHQGYSCDELKCTEEINHKNQFCYQAACYQTAKLLAAKLGIQKDQYSVSFQSRFSKNWLAPHTDEILEDLASNNKKNVLVVCPSFVADCLETLHEIEIEYAGLFKKAGGEKLTLVPALNSDNDWVKAFGSIVR